MNQSLQSSDPYSRDESATSHDATTAVHTGLEDQIHTLRERLISSTSWPSPEDGFSLWITHPDEEKLCGLSTHRAANAIESFQDRFHEAPILASAGYIIDLKSISSVDFSAPWVAGLQQLSQKTAPRKDRQSFLYRPEELLGICLGTSALESDLGEEAEWLREILIQAESEYSAPGWRHAIGKLSAGHLGVRWDEGFRLPLSDMSIEEKALCLLLSTDDRISPQLSFALPDTEHLISDLLSSVLVEGHSTDSLSGTATTLKASVWCTNMVVEDIVETYFDPKRREQKRRLRAENEQNRKRALNASLAGKRIGRGIRKTVNRAMIPLLVISALVYFSNKTPNWVPFSLGTVLILLFAVDWLMKSELRTILGQSAERWFVSFWRKHVLGND